MSVSDEYELHVRAGTSIDSLQPVSVNELDKPVELNSNLFKGYLAVRVKNYSGPGLKNPPTDYFSQKQRLYSITVMGEFFDKDLNGDTLVFGIELNKPIKKPPGASIGLKIAKWLEPSLEYDLDASTPWMNAPLISTLGVIHVGHHQTWSTDQMTEDTHEWFSNNVSMESKERKRYFYKSEHRKLISFENKLMGMEFYDAHFDFEEFKILLPGFKLNAFKYFDNHIIRFKCEDRVKNLVFFMVEFEMIKK